MVTTILKEMAQSLETVQDFFGKGTVGEMALQQEAQLLQQRFLAVPEELQALGLHELKAGDASQALRLTGWMERPPGVAGLLASPVAETLDLLATVADHLAQPPYRIPCLQPSLFALDQEKKLRTSWLHLRSLGLEEGQSTLKTHQREARYVLHPLLTRPFSAQIDADLPGAMRYSFALFLLRLLFPGTQLFQQHQALDRLRDCEPTLPPEIPLLLAEALQTSLLPPCSKEGCRCLWAAMRQAVEEALSLEKRAPSLHLQTQKESYVVSGRYKRGPLQDAELTSPLQKDPLLLSGVADGVSRADLGSGEEAVRVIATSFTDLCLERFDQLIDPQGWPEAGKIFLRDFATTANNRLVERWNFFLRHRPKEEPVEDPMSSTMVAAVVLGDTAAIAWLGDSPAWHYQARSRRLIRLSTSHNVQAERLRMEDFDALHNPSAEDRHLSRMIGCGAYEPSSVDYVPETPETEMLLRRFEAGDLLLLATDGLVDSAGLPGDFACDARLEKMLGEQLQTGQDLQALVAHLAAWAEQQSQDNITIVAIQFQPASVEEASSAENKQSPTREADPRESASAAPVPPPSSPETLSEKTAPEPSSTVRKGKGKPRNRRTKGRSAPSRSEEKPDSISQQGKK